MRLNRVDLPTFGRPTITTAGISFDMTTCNDSFAVMLNWYRDGREFRPKPECRCGVSSARTACWRRNIRLSSRGQGQLDMALAVEEALRRKPQTDRRSRDRNRKDARLSGAGAALRSAASSFPPAPRRCRSSFSFAIFPFSNSVFDRPLRVCYMKGRSNYACRQKIYEAENAPALSGLEEVADFQIIRDWEKTTEIGRPARKFARFPRTARPGARSTRGPNFAPGRSASSMSAASSP